MTMVQILFTILYTTQIVISGIIPIELRQVRRTLDEHFDEIGK